MELCSGLYGTFNSTYINDIFKLAVASVTAAFSYKWLLSSGFFPPWYQSELSFLAESHIVAWSSCSIAAWPMRSAAAISFGPVHLAAIPVVRFVTTDLHAITANSIVESHIGARSS